MGNIQMDLSSRADSEEDIRTTENINPRPEQDKSTMIMTKCRMSDVCKQDCISMLQVKFNG